MTFYRVFPEPTAEADPTTEGGRSLLTSLYAREGARSVRANLIATPSGQTVGADHTSNTLTSADDRMLVGLLRGMADAVVVGAQTLRGEHVPLPRGVPLIVLSRSGNIRPALWPVSTEGSALVVVTTVQSEVDGVPNHIAHEVVRLEPGNLEPPRLVEFFADRGWNHLLVEGGVSTVVDWAKKNVLDELCLTLTGPPEVSSQPPIGWWPEGQHMETRHVLTDSQRLLYYRFSRPGSASKKAAPSAR